MASNKKATSVFTGIIASTAAFYIIASGGALALGHLLFPSKDFGENTYIGPYDVSDFKEIETTKLLNEGFADIDERFDVNIIYQDASFQLPKEAVVYDMESTIDGSETGQENPIIVHLKDDSLRALLDQHLGVLNLQEEEISAITDGVERRLRSGMMPANIQITDFLDVSRATVSENVVSHTYSGQPVTNGIQSGMKALDGVQIGPGSALSFLDLMAEAETEVMSAEEMTRIASLLYSTILQTNFIIDERSISEQLPEGIPEGYEAAVNPATGMDLMFTNPNGSTFTIRTDVIGDSMTIGLEGLPLMYDYSTSVTGREGFEPRTIKQFSGNVTTGSPRIDEEGKEGFRITVIQHVTDGSVEMSMKEVSKDFYPPVHRIEVHRLKPEETPATLKDIIEKMEDDGIEDPSSEDQSDSDSTDSNGSDTGSSESTGGDDTGDGSGGNRSEDHNPAQNRKDEIIYDKGGNPVEP